MNMLPTNITLTDINNLNPFQASLQSQVITDGRGNKVYPKTTYQIESQDSSDGTIKIKVNYDYVPMSVNYAGENDKSYTFGLESIQEKQVLTYTDEKTYTVFKENDNSAFWFTGAEKNQKIIILKLLMLLKWLN